EADDLIATFARMAREEGHQVVIVSSDKDLMQLVGDGVSMLDPAKNLTIGREEVVERFGVGPESVIDVQALAGDSTDNVPGVPGIGIKTAADLIRTYGDLDTLLDRADEIKQPKRRQNLIENADMARLSRDLVTLRIDAPVEQAVDDLISVAPDADTLGGFLREHGFKSMLAQMGTAADAAGADTAAPGPEAAERDYSLVDDAAELARWIAEATRAGAVAVDTETTSLDSMRAELVGVSLSIEPGRACYVPLAHVAPGGGTGDLIDGPQDAPRQIPMADALTALKPLLEDPGVLKIGHNIKYDMEVLARYGIEVAPVDDTMLLSYVLEAGMHGHGLDELCKLHFGHANIKFSDVAGSGRKAVTFAEVPLDAARDYAAEDADMTGRLHRLLKPRLVADRMATVYETLERPLVAVLAGMERAGIKVDVSVLGELSRDFESRGAALAEKIYAEAGHDFNIGSPRQLGAVLFEEMGLEGGKKTKQGAYATGADILEGLAAQGHTLPRLVLDWRQLAKLRSTYTEALAEAVNPATGRVHTSFAQAIASTGRLSSNEPNLQNIPVRTEDGRRIREAFVAEKGHTLLSADYSQIELRLLAHVADIEALKHAFHEGADIHARTAGEVFGLPVEGMDPAVRNRAKAINFGIIYGISPFGLGRQLGIPQSEARAYIEAYFEHYPGIRDYMETTKAFARAHGYVTTAFGRRCHTPAIADKNPARRNFSERAAINAPLQGAAADIIKRAMIRLPEALADAGLGARMLLQVHDELLFEVPDGEVDDTAALVARTMEAAAHLSVPLTVETGRGPSWAEAH
ncbi:MAG: DNA polymerase I, partial [Defluviicoccus sp.]|nr:DNA polymerase I [Defluviicoccus sp.]